MPAEMCRDEPVDLAGALIGHEPASDLRTRPCRHNRLAAGTLIAAGNAVDLKRRPRPAALERCEILLARQCGYAKFSGVSALIERERSKLFSFARRQRQHVVVEAGNCNATVLVYAGREKFGQFHHGIGDTATEDSAMQITVGAIHAHLECSNAARAVGDGGMFL